jgi:hypothetical protein
VLHRGFKVNVGLRGSWQGFVRTGLFVVALVWADSALAQQQQRGRFFCEGSPAQQGQFTNSSFQSDNAQVLRWKLTTPNQFKARAFVQGRISKLYGEQGDHTHFAIQLGRNPQEILEVVYNKAFGALPPLRVGSVVVACGDYITASARSPQGHPASPAGAIVHWVHMSDNGNHPSGFVMIDNVMYGNRPGR